MSWLVHAGSYAASVVVRAATPSPGPSLRPGLEESDVAPGFLGFIITFAVVAATVVIMVSMTRRVRRLGHRDGEDHVVEADIRLDPEPMGEIPPTLKEQRQARKRAAREAADAAEKGSAEPGPPDAG